MALLPAQTPPCGKNPRLVTKSKNAFCAVPSCCVLLIIKEYISSVALGQVEKGENNTTDNKSLDVRAKQLLCLDVSLFSFTFFILVSPHVNSIVRRLAVAKRKLHFA